MSCNVKQSPATSDWELMDDIHLLTASHFRSRYELHGGKMFSSYEFEAREVCFASQNRSDAICLLSTGSDMLESLSVLSMPYK